MIKFKLDHLFLIMANLKIVDHPLIVFNMSVKCSNIFLQKNKIDDTQKFYWIWTMLMIKQ